MSTFHGGKLQPLPDLLKKLKGESRQQTNEEILAAMRIIRETMAGAVSDKPQPA